MNGSAFEIARVVRERCGLCTTVMCFPGFVCGHAGERCLGSG
jgi:hypothetical protein